MSINELLKLENASKKYDEANMSLYLSYPTLGWWKTETVEHDVVQSFSRCDELFLYFHFPYCKKPCYYCMCYNRIAKNNEEIERYIHDIATELRHKLSIFHIDRFRDIKHIHWGGGTPTYLAESQLARIGREIFNKCEIIRSEDASISIEAYPDEDLLHSKKIELIKELGFTEISFGIQDFDGRIQKAINRNCSERVLDGLIEKCKNLGLKVHIDLCYGLPYQGLNEIQKTVSKIIRMNPDRIAMLSYAHYPNFYPLQKYIPFSSIPNSFIRILQAKLAEDLFTTGNYKKVGFDHFVRENNPLYEANENKTMFRDLMGYSVEGRRNVLGFGLSAISFLDASYYQNRLRIEDYFNDISRGTLPLETNVSHHLSPDDILRNGIIQKNIMCDFEIDLHRIGKEYNLIPDEYFQDELVRANSYAQDGLLNITGDKISITEMGKDFTRHIAHIFDRYYHGK